MPSVPADALGMAPWQPLLKGKFACLPSIPCTRERNFCQLQGRPSSAGQDTSAVTKPTRPRALLCIQAVYRPGAAHGDLLVPSPVQHAIQALPGKAHALRIFEIMNTAQITSCNAEHDAWRATRVQRERLSTVDRLAQGPARLALQGLQWTDTAMAGRTGRMMAG